MKQLLIIVLAIVLILFVLVPAAFIFLGKVGNPLAIGPIDGITPQYTNNGNGAVQHTQVAAAGGLASLWKITDTKARTINCESRTEAYEPHVRDATLKRNGEKSIVSSDTYTYRLTLPQPVYDWAYTKGSLLDESASFVYGNTIINILARTAKTECNQVAAKIYKDFHNKNGGVEYFSSRTYLEQNAPLGLTKAILRTSGDGEVGGTDYYWYILDEEYNNDPQKAVTTIWYSARINRTEYWFAFRIPKAMESDLNKAAEDVLERIDFNTFVM